MSPYEMFLEALIWKKTNGKILELESHYQNASSKLNQLFKRNDMPLIATKPRNRDVVLIKRKQYQFTRGKHELARR